MRPYPEVPLNDPALYAQTAGTTIPYAAIVCYPTRADNTAQGYSLPNGSVVPAMQHAPAAWRRRAEGRSSA